MNDFSLPTQAMTAKEYREAMTERGRPLSDRAIGGYTQGKRNIDAESSAAFNHDHDVERTETLEEMLRRRRAEMTRRTRSHDPQTGFRWGAGRSGEVA